MFVKPISFIAFRVFSLTRLLRDSKEVSSKAPERKRASLISEHLLSKLIAASVSFAYKSFLQQENTKPVIPTMFPTIVNKTLQS